MSQIQRTTVFILLILISSVNLKNVNEYLHQNDQRCREYLTEDNLFYARSRRNYEGIIQYKIYEGSNNIVFCVELVKDIPSLNRNSTYTLSEPIKNVTCDLCCDTKSKMAYKKQQKYKDVSYFRKSCLTEPRIEQEKTTTVEDGCQIIN